MSDILDDVHQARIYWAHRLHATVLNAIGAAILQSQVCEDAARGALPSTIDELARLRRMLMILERQTRVLTAAAARPEAGTFHGEIAGAVHAARAEGLPVRVRIVGRAGAVPRRVARGAGVVLREALANAARHAHPSSVAVEITVRDGTLLLRVRDDGAGCDAARLQASARGRRCGLMIMRAQATALGGRLELSSAPARGTQVTLFVPLPARLGGTRAPRAIPAGAGVPP